MEINNDLILRAPRFRNRIMPINTQTIDMIFDEDSSDEYDYYNDNVNYNSIKGNSNDGWRSKIIFNVKLQAQFGRM